MNDEIYYKGWFWCYVRKDYFRWEEYIKYYKENKL